MISERSGDGKMMIGVEIDMEIEEGEASYFQNGDKPTIDPDVSLSYIDDRIEDILGHFQKDFEGGVSAENLGAKFGGYGSFLPTYARSPACSQPRTASEVIDTHKYSRILDLEASQLSSVASSCSSPPLLFEAGSTANPQGHGSINGRVKGDGSMPFYSGKTPTLIGEQKSEFPCDQRTLKVRLRVGSNNLLARKNAEIYSGLGLDGSPSPSRNDSFTDSEGLSHDIRDPSGNSPTRILKIMTSFLLQGTKLLSPLSEELICFTEKEIYVKESASKPLHKGKVNRYESRKDVREPLPEKKIDPYEKGDLLESGEHINVGLLSKRETDVNDLACEGLATKALKLPLLSNKHPSPHCPAEGSVKTSDHLRGSNQGPLSMKFAEEQPFEHKSVQEIGRVQKPEGNVASSLNISTHEKENLVDNCTVTKKPSRHKGQRNIVSAKVESGLPEQEKAPSGELFDSRETKIMQAALSNDDIIENQAQGQEQLCAISGNELEGGQTNDSLNNFALYERNNGSHVNSLFTKNALVDTSKDLKKNTNKYQGHVGDIEHNDNEVALKETSSVKKSDSKLEENGSTLEDIRITTEKSSVRKTGIQYKADDYPRASSNEKVPSTVAEPKSDAISSVPASELEDNWVLCDKCQKWRLLPLGRNLKSLPEKWMCSMLDWLPAMNLCTASEEETTNATRALFQASGPLGKEYKLPGHPGNHLSVLSSTGVSYSAHNGQLLDQQTSLSGGKKTLKPKDDLSGPVCGEPLQLSKSVKNHEEENKSYDCVNQSSLVDAYSNQYVGQCSTSLSEKPAKNTHKQTLAENYLVLGDLKKSKTRKRRQSDSDSSRSSKKVKPQDVIYNDENCNSAPPVHLLKSGNYLGHSSPNHMPRKDRPATDGHPKDVKNEFPNHVTATEINYDDALPNHKRNNKSSYQKKEGQGEQGIHSYVGDFPQRGHRSRCNSEDNERKVKKARTSNSEGEVTITRNSTCETGKKARKSIDKPVGQVRGSSATADSLKRDIGTVHPSVASTSSSSKASGSCKINISCQEVKGSPVESVSSSPLRVLSTVRCALTSRNPLERDERDDTYVDNCSPRGSLGGATNKVNHSTSVLQDKDLGFVSGSKIKEGNKSSSDFASQPINNADSKGNQDTCKNQASERYQDERKDDRTFNGGSHSRKSENGNGNCTFSSENDKVHFMSPDSKNRALDIPLSNRKLTGGRSSVSSDKDGKNFIYERSSGIKDFGAISDPENKSTPGCDDHLDDKLNMKECIGLDRDASNKLFSDIRSASEISGSGKSNTLPPSLRFKNDKGAHLPLSSNPHKENAVDNSLSDAHGDTLKTPEQNKKGEKQNGSTPSRHSNSTMHKVRDQDGSSVRKDSRSQAATNAMKEAKDLKRLADRFKNSGSTDSTGMYFEAALKFLYGASLLESGSRENNKHNDAQCIDMYRSTAKFCEFCAHEYERSKDMVSASLAYKCMEVSYMRVVYTSHVSTNKDRNEVQKALQIVPPGESPASSASDVDNLNNPVLLDKVSTSKGMTSPQIAENTGITARNRSSFTRLLEYAQDVSAAMDAAKKSRSTFTAANLRSEDANFGDGISSVKKALDFNFQDVEGLLRLIRIAKDAISR